MKDIFGIDLASEKGATLIEASLVLVVFLGIFLGIIDLGWIMHQQLAISQGAREGARQAAIARNMGCPDAVVNYAQQVTSNALAENRVSDASNLSHIRARILPKNSPPGSTLVNDLIYQARFIEVSVDKNVRCFFCVLIPGPMRVVATATERLEDPWMCESNPYPFFDF